MKYLILLLLSFSAIAENYHDLSVRYRDGDNISHLSIKNDIGIQFDFRRDISAFSYRGGVYVSKSNLSDTNGFYIGTGVNYKYHAISINYAGEQNHEKWRIQKGDCKACNLDWINSNWRDSYFVRYDFDKYSFKPFVEYHKIIHDRDELLDNRFNFGVQYSFKVIDRDLFIRASHDSEFMLVNIGFVY